MWWKKKKPENKQKQKPIEKKLLPTGHNGEFYGVRF